MRISQLLLLLVIVTTAFSSCRTSDHLIVKEGADFDTLHVSLKFTSNIDTMLIAEYESRLERAIVRHNKTYPFRFVAVASKEPVEPALVLEIDSVRIATSDDQISAFTLSMLGIGLPIALVASGIPFPFIVWFNSSNNVYTLEGLSDDIRNTSVPPYQRNRYRSMGGWFRGHNRNIKVSAVIFENRVYKHLRQINRNLPNQ